VTSRDPSVEPLVWKDHEDAERLILGGESVLVSGPPGVGKSTLVSKCVLGLRAAGKRVQIVAKTHVAADVAGGDTVDHFVHRHVRNGGTSADVIVVDEVSMLNAALLIDLNHLTFRPKPVQWVLVGDFNQLLPRDDDLWRGGKLPAFEHSGLLKTMAGCNRSILRTFHRSDNAFHQEWFMSLAAVPRGSRVDQPLGLTARQLREAFPPENAVGFIAGTRLAPNNFVMSHAKRLRINALCNNADRESHPEAVFLSLEEYGGPAVVNAPQDVWVWPGMRMIAQCSGRMKLRNGREYTVLSVGQEVVLRHDPPGLEALVESEKRQ
jgi:hypothetical protein